MVGNIRAAIHAPFSDAIETSAASLPTLLPFAGNDAICKALGLAVLCL